MEPCDQAGGDEAQNVADVGDHTEHGHEHANQKSVGQTIKRQRDADQNAIDESDEYLASKE